MIAPIIVAALYFAVLYFSSGLTPLWIDELFQASNTRHASLPGVVHYAATCPGGVPLPYIIQKFTFDIFGDSTRSVRLPASLFAALGAAAFVLLTRELGVRRRNLAVLLFLLLPLPFRYGMEARGYALGLCLSILSLLLLVKLARRPGFLLAFAYGLTLACCIYSQPYAGVPVFLAGAWRFYRGEGSRWLVAIPTILAAVAFVPWFLLIHSMYIPTVTAFDRHQLAPLLLVRELSGGGYFCSIPLILLPLAAFGRGAAKNPYLLLLGVVAAGSLLGPMAMDATFNYFFAVRQFLFATPALAILAVEGADRLYRESNRAAAVVLAGALFVSAAVKDVKQASIPLEDWVTPSRILAADLAQGGCVVTAPRDFLQYYAYYQPWLQARACDPQRTASTVVAAVSRYATPEDRKKTIADLDAALSRVSSAQYGTTEITVYRH